MCTRAGTFLTNSVCLRLVNVELLRSKKMNLPGAKSENASVASGGTSGQGKGGGRGGAPFLRKQNFSRKQSTRGPGSEKTSKSDASRNRSTAVGGGDGGLQRMASITSASSRQPPAALKKSSASPLSKRAGEMMHKESVGGANFGGDVAEPYSAGRYTQEP